MVATGAAIVAMQDRIVGPTITPSRSSQRRSAAPASIHNIGATRRPNNRANAGKFQRRSFVRRHRRCQIRRTNSRANTGKFRRHSFVRRHRLYRIHRTNSHASSVLPNVSVRRRASNRGRWSSRRRKCRSVPLRNANHTEKIATRTVPRWSSPGFRRADRNSVRRNPASPRVNAPAGACACLAIGTRSGRSVPCGRVGADSVLAGLNAQSPHFFPERLARNAERFGGVGHVPVVTVQCDFQKVAFAGHQIVRK